MIDACKILGKAKQAVTPTTLVTGMKSHKTYSLVLHNYISLLIKRVTSYGQFYSCQQFANYLKKPNWFAEWYIQDIAYYRQHRPLGTSSVNPPDNTPAGRSFGQCYWKSWLETINRSAHKAKSRLHNLKQLLIRASHSMEVFNFPENQIWLSARWCLRSA